MSRIWSRLALLLSLAAPTVRADAQQRGGQTVPRFHSKVTVTDTVQISHPALSPDHKWVLYDTYEVGRSNIWVVPADGGAPPHQLTNGNHVDIEPHWFPKGDRIAFESDRTKSIMVLDFDKATGSAVGTPRRITLEEAKSFAIAPDGSKIAYIMDWAVEAAVLKMVPATGGKAVTLAEIPPQIALPVNPCFSPDGAWIYFSASSDRTNRLASLFRVAVTGGKPELVSPKLTFPVNAQNLIPVPGEQLIVLRRADKKGTVVTFGGDTVSTFDLMQSPGDFSRIALDGTSFLFSYGQIVAPTRVVGVDGRARTIGKASEYEWPASWSRDGKRLLATLDPGSYAIMNVDGSARSVERVSPTNLTVPPLRVDRISADWRYLLGRPSPDRRTPTHPLYIYDRETKTAREVTARAEQNGILTASGDWFGTNHGEFLYAAGTADRLEIHGVKPSGADRVIRTFPRDVAAHTSFGVDGDKIVYQTVAGDSASLFVITESNGEPKRLMTIRGRFEEMVWSPDTKTIAALASSGKSGAEKLTAELIFVPVATPTQSRSIPLGDGGYETVWTPDSRAVFFLKADKGWMQTSVWRYPVRADEPARNVTQNETGMMWGYQLSPDGAAVLLPEEQNRGSSLWRIDLAQAAASYRDAKAKGTQAGKIKP